MNGMFFISMVIVAIAMIEINAAFAYPPWYNNTKSDKLEMNDSDEPLPRTSNWKAVWIIIAGSIFMAMIIYGRKLFYVIKFSCYEDQISYTTMESSSDV